MPRLSLKDARALQASFEGRITSLHEAQAEVRGKARTLIPSSIADLEKALSLARAANRQVFVRSGGRMAITDVVKTTAQAGRKAAIVSLEAFQNIALDGTWITVEAAATTGELARKLAGNDLFLPLEDNPTQSIVSAVLKSGVSPFLRSGGGLGALRSNVVQAEIVPVEGAGAGRATTLNRQAFRELLDSGRPAVITKLVFDAVKAEESRWTRAWTTAYEPKAFATLCDVLFGGAGKPVPERVDLSLRVTSAAFSMNLVILRATGHGEADSAAIEKIARAAFAAAELPVLDSMEATGAGSSIAAWVAAGTGEAGPGEIVTRFGSSAAPRPLAAFRQELHDAVHFALGVSARTGRELAPGIRGFMELQLTPDGTAMAHAEIADAKAKRRVAREAARRLASAMPAVATAAIRTALRGVEALAELTPTRGFDLMASNRTGASKIPGFKGDVFDESDGRRYQKEIQQYAVSSYSKAVVEARMTPGLAAVPIDADDVVAAVTFAASRGLKVVARSGGHQYCGLSSGGADTVLVDMKLFNKKATFFPDTGTPQRVTVGPGVALKDVSLELRDKGVAIPHGECPLVNLGGHVQSGGIGHQLRSLGATLDHVHSFKMVTRDPADGVYKELEFNRPAGGGGTGAPTKDDVFRAVLGGGPSSWGVLTEITFDLVPDGRYPDSEGYSYTYPYSLVEDGFKAAMKQFEEWATQQHSGQLPAGVDLFLTVISGDFPRPAALLVETMCRDTSGLPTIKNTVKAVDDAVSVLARTFAHLSSKVQGRTFMSVIADEGVREIGMFGLPKSGHEFDLPYKKSLHITKLPFSSQFCDRFVGLVDQVYANPGLKVVFQGVIGGGDFSANGLKGTTHMQRRDGLVQLVFDVFYKSGNEAAAENFQNQMKALLQDYSGGADLRMIWGTFEDAGTNGRQLDMSRSQVQDFYYDSPAEYQRLQQIKKYTDPEDLFHTSLTVQLP